MVLVGNDWTKSGARDLLKPLRSRVLLRSIPNTGRTRRLKGAVFAQRLNNECFCPSWNLRRCDLPVRNAPLARSPTRPSPLKPSRPIMGPGRPPHSQGAPHVHPHPLSPPLHPPRPRLHPPQKPGADGLDAHGAGGGRRRLRAAGRLLRGAGAWRGGDDHHRGHSAQRGGRLWRQAVHAGRGRSAPADHRRGARGRCGREDLHADPAHGRAGAQPGVRGALCGEVAHRATTRRRRWTRSASRSSWPTLPTAPRSHARRATTGWRSSARRATCCPPSWCRRPTCAPTPGAARSSTACASPWRWCAGCARRWGRTSS
jgi:hypothetical protein